MIGGSLVAPLDSRWMDHLDGIARAHRWPGLDDVDGLSARVRALSTAYNDDGNRAFGRLDLSLLAARLLFSFPRDVPKAAGAIREIAACGRLGPGPISVLDLGSGPGAASWGIARVAEAVSAGPITATLVDSDAAALDLARAIAAGAPCAAPITVKTLVGDVRHPPPGTFDVVIAMQVLSELDRDLAPEVRLVEHAKLVLRWLDRTAENGTLVIVEPALRERARHLHALKPALIAAGASIFAPCLHAAPCPLAERDWCHEDLPVDLPDRLVPVARAAGLRWERATYAYLAIRRDGATLRGALDGGSRLARVVGSPPKSKGRRDHVVCGDGFPAVRIDRLDRDASDANAAWDDASRGDVLALDPPATRVRRDDPVTPIRT